MKPGAGVRRAACLAASLGLLLAAGTPAAGDSVDGSAHASGWFVIRLDTPVPGAAAPDGALALATGSPALDALIDATGVHRIEYALRASMRAPRDRAARARHGLDRTYRFHVPVGSDVREVAARFSGAPGVVYAEPDFVGTGGATLPDDPRFGDQWGFSQPSDADTDAPEAWDVSTGDGVIIAVLDSGIDSDHPDLAARILPGHDFVNDDSDPEDDHGHGTNVSSIAAAVTNNGTGVAGSCWNCPIMPLKVLDSNNNGSYSDWADALTWATDNGARVINLSAGGTMHSAILQNAGRYAHDAGVIYVSITHNDDTGTIRYPGRYQETITVGGTDEMDRRASPFCYSGTSGSNWGNQTDVVAPGELILGAAWGGGYNYWCGTSQAAPLVAGLVGMMETIYPSLGREEARHLIWTGADDQVGRVTEDTAGWDVYHGFGRVNMDRTMRGTAASITLRVEGKTATRVWYETANPLADSYDFVRGNLSALSEDPQDGVLLGTVTCLENDSADPDTAGGNEDTATPAPGAAFFYLGRFSTAQTGAGSYGGSSLNRDRCKHVADGCTAVGDCAE